MTETPSTIRIFYTDEPRKYFDGVVVAENNGCYKVMDDTMPMFLGGRLSGLFMAQHGGLAMRKVRVSYGLWRKAKIWPAIRWAIRLGR